MILDFYFKRPLFWDYLIAICVLVVLILYYHNDKISLPEIQDSYSLTGDLNNIALTLAGFILTILTVLITFKDNSANREAKEDDPVFNKFFSTGFYFETVRHLKNCIKSIIIIAAFGFFFKLFLQHDYRKFLYFFNVAGILITILTIFRCLLILSKVLELQKAK